MTHPFGKADILLPQAVSMEKWAVIACDQFVSQSEYWQQVRQLVGNSPSALKLILPEADLTDDNAAAIASINQTMTDYLNQQIFRTYPESFIYIERTLLNGKIRRGVIGAVDLEQYDFTPQSCSAIRATEETVADRLPPRMEIRRDATLELPHVLLLCDDDQQLLLDSLAAKKDTLPLLYDFELMLGGGRIRGWLVTGQEEQAFTAQLEKYEKAMQKKYGNSGMLYAVGDGNHSLAAAKGCYELLKKEGACPQAARYALTELENIHDNAQVFEPIHRIIKATDPDALIAAMQKAIGSDSGTPITWYAGGKEGRFYVDSQDGTLPVGIVQDFLDSYLASHSGDVDYIHGEDALRQLSAAENSLGLLLPPVEKSAFFQGILAGGTLPRKTFSMGHAQEKRYYLEARKIL